MKRYFCNVWKFWNNSETTNLLRLKNGRLKAKNGYKRPEADVLRLKTSFLYTSKTHSCAN